jgi:hypothetical protein
MEAADLGVRDPAAAGSRCSDGMVRTARSDSSPVEEAGLSPFDGKQLREGALPGQGSGLDEQRPGSTSGRGRGRAGPPALPPQR